MAFSSTDAEPLMDKVAKGLGIKMKIPYMEIFTQNTKYDEKYPREFTVEKVDERASEIVQILLALLLTKDLKY